MEVYGQGRIVEAAHGCRRNLNLHGLDALDLRTCKPDGDNWDFNRAEDRRMARDLVESRRPTWIIGSPPCTSFTLFNTHWNFPRCDPQKVQAWKEEGIRHLRFMISLYKIQLDNGRHVLHEHPVSALSWEDPAMKAFLQHPKDENYCVGSM